MSLAQKTLLIISATLTVLLVILYGLSTRVFLHSFSVLEEQSVSLSLQRVDRALQTELDGLQANAAELAAGLDPARLPQELDADALARLNVDRVQAYDAVGRLVFDSPARVQDSAAPDLPLMAPAAGSRAGLIAAPDGPAILAAGVDPASGGTLVLVRRLDASEIERLATLAQASLELLPLAEARDDPALQDVVARLDPDPTRVIVAPYSDLTVRGYTTLSDAGGAPALLMYVSLPRSIYQEGQAATRTLLISGAVIGLAAGALTLLLMNRLVLSRLSRLMAGVARIGASSDPTSRVDLPGSDELARLAAEINAMLEALASTQNRLRDSQDQVQRQLETINRLYTASLQLTGRLEPDQVAAALVNACVAELGAGFARVGSRQAAGAYRWLAWAPAGDGRGPGEAHFSADSLDGTPRVVGDLAAVPGLALAPDAGDGLRACALFPLAEVLGAPGVLAVYAAGAEAFTPSHLEAYQTFANQAETALRQATLFQQVLKGRRRLQDLSRRLVEVQEAERRALASELHDEIGQALTALKINVDLALRTASPGEDARLRQAQGMVDDLLGRVRELTLELRPPMLDDLGLLPTLLWLFGKIREGAGLKVDFHHQGIDRRFPPEIETAAYRIVQEALTNVVRHAGVRRASVRFTSVADTLEVEVADRGAGFDVDEALAAGASSGLSGIRERVNLLGGEIDITAAPGAGTTLRVRLPLAGRIERRRRARE